MSSQQPFNKPMHSLTSSSLTFTSGSLSGMLGTGDKNRLEEEMAHLRKQMRQKEADFTKERAILLQQVELLKMQLCEAAEREINLKKINQSIMDAIKRQEETPQKEKPQQEVNEDHPVVQEIMIRLKNEYRQILQNEKDRNRDMEYNLEKENQQLQFKLHDIERKLEIKEQDLQRKILESLEIQKKHDDNLKSSVDRVRAELNLQIKQLEMDLDAINQDIDRQVNIRLNDRYLKEQGLNESIIKYQREQQELFSQIKDLRKTIENKESEIQSQVDKVKRYEDENGSLKFKMKQQERKIREEQDAQKKMKDDLNKNKSKFPQRSKKLISSAQTNQGSSTAREKSRNPVEKKVNNKENQLSNPKFMNDEAPLTEDEEKNKLRRQLSLMRCQIKKLEIEMKDQKSKFIKEIAILRDKLNVEKKKRMNIYEEKLDKNNQLLQDLLEKDQTIIQLNKQLSRLQEKLQYVNGGRSFTPNHHLYMSQAHDSGVMHNLANSQIDLNGMQSQSFTSKLLSPMRSLDFTGSMPPLHNSSFNILPQVKNHRNKKGLQISPKQIKRNRVHSFKVPQSATIYSSQQRFRQSSRDASIAEVNEDLYRDSVESGGGDHEIKDFKNGDIIAPIQQRKIIVHAKRNQVVAQSHDQELQEVLYHQQMSQHVQSRKFRQEVYYDSLENESDQDQTYFFKGSNHSRHPSQYESQQQSSSQFRPNFPRSIVNSNTQKRYTSTTMTNDSLIMQTNKQNQRKTEQDDDCMVNILENDNANDQNSTNNNIRINSSSDNLLSDISKAFENLKQENLKKQTKLGKQGQQRNKNKNVPKPHIPSLILQKKNEQQFNKSQLEINEMKQSFPKGNQVPPQFSDYQMVISPQNEESLNPLKQCDSDEGCDLSPSPNKRLTRNDSCPSPLDETETVLMLGSGQKLRVQDNVGNMNLNMYQNQFKEQKTLQMFSSLNSQSNVRQSVQLNLKYEKQSGRNQPQQINNHNIHPGMRNRTNSLINSCSSEANFKMKFIRDMPNNTETSQIHLGPQLHKRIPSNTLMNQSMQFSMHGFLSTRKN